jgi:hypothetical protein
MRTVTVTVQRPDSESFVITSPTGRTLRVSLTAISGWADRTLRAKLQNDTADLTIHEMNVLRQNGWIMEEVK